MYKNNKNNNKQHQHKPSIDICKENKNKLNICNIFLRYDTLRYDTYAELCVDVKRNVI